MRTFHLSAVVFTLDLSSNSCAPGAGFAKSEIDQSISIMVNARYYAIIQMFLQTKPFTSLFDIFPNLSNIINMW